MGTSYSRPLQGACHQNLGHGGGPESVRPPVAGSFGAPAAAGVPIALPDLRQVPVAPCQMAMAGPAFRVPVLNQPPAVAWAVSNSTTVKTVCRGPTPLLPKLWYGAVKADGTARSLLSTFDGGRWLDADGAPLPSGALLFDSAPRARGWLVANMGASSRVYEAGAEPVGCVP